MTYMNTVYLLTLLYLFKHTSNLIMHAWPEFVKLTWVSSIYIVACTSQYMQIVPAIIILLPLEQAILGASVQAGIC